MGLSAVIAIIMAIAFLPGVFAQQSAIESGVEIGAREQVGAATGAATGAIAGLTAQIAPIAASLGVGVEALLGGVFGGVFSLFTSGLVFILSCITPIWTCLPTSMVDCYQEIIGTIGDIIIIVMAIIGDILPGGLIGGIIGTMVDLFQSCSYWIGDIFLGLQSIVGTCSGYIWSCFTPCWSALFSLVGFLINGGWNAWQEFIGTIGDFAALFGAEGADYVEGILDNAICFDLIFSWLMSVSYAVGSACILGTLGGFIGTFTLYGPFALCFWPCAVGCALCQGGISAFANTIAGCIGGGLANVISLGISFVGDVFPPCNWLGLVGAGHPVFMSVGVGWIGAIVGALAGAILGAILGGITAIPLIPAIWFGPAGIFIGALIGAFSGLIVGFGTGLIAAGH